MKIAIVPLSVVAHAGRMDAEFFCDPGKAQRKKAARNRELAEQNLRAAERAEAEANAEVERSRALGIVAAEGGTP